MPWIMLLPKHGREDRTVWMARWANFLEAEVVPSGEAYRLSGVGPNQWPGYCARMFAGALLLETEGYLGKLTGDAIVALHSMDKPVLVWHAGNPHTVVLTRAAGDNYKAYWIYEPGPAWSGHA